MPLSELTRVIAAIETVCTLDCDANSILEVAHDTDGGPEGAIVGYEATFSAEQTAAELYVELHPMADGLFGVIAVSDSDELVDALQKELDGAFSSIGPGGVAAGYPPQPIEERGGENRAETDVAMDLEDFPTLLERVARLLDGGFGPEEQARADAEVQALPGAGGGQACAEFEVQSGGETISLQVGGFYEGEGEFTAWFSSTPELIAAVEGAIDELGEELT